jgi:hypothetical protein
VGTYAYRVGPLGGTQYGMYAANWTYNTCTPVQEVWMWPRRNVPGLGLTDGDVGLLRGVECDILAQGLIGLCHTPFRERGNKASIRVPKMFKSHAWQQYDKQMQCYK